MKTMRWWDLAVGGVLLAMAAAALSSGVRGASLAGALGALSGILLAYLLAGRRLIARADTEQERPGAGLAYLAAVAILATVGVAADPNLATLQVLLYPMLWMLTPGYGRAVLRSALLALLLGVGFWWGFVPGYGPANSAVIAFGVQALSLSFAIAMGTWITRIAVEGSNAKALVAQLTAAQGELAQLSAAAGAAEERERLSRELHDTLTQTLTGLVMLAERAGTQAPADSPAAASLSLIERSAREALGEARSLVRRTNPLGEHGLADAMKRLGQRAEEETGLRVLVDAPALRLPRELEVVLLRCAQEGIANVRKHAAATQASISLGFGFDSDPAGGHAPRELVLLSVRDNGRGPAAPGGAPGGGFGLAGMRERVALVGGRLSLTAGPHGGAQLDVRLPLPAPGPTPGAPAPNAAQEAP